MRKPEQILWDQLSGVMHDSWEATRIESKVGRNVPDLYFRFGGYGAFCGWIELKQIAMWNRKAHLPTRVPNLTEGQKRWLFDHDVAAGNTWLLLHIRLSNEFMFFRGCTVRSVGDLTRKEMYNMASDTFTGLPDAKTIRLLLDEGNRNVG